MIEYWVKVRLDTDFKYEVSNLGNLRRVLDDGNFKDLNPFIGRNGSLLVSICINKKRSTPKNVNTLVLKSFFPNNYYHQRKIKHINGIKTNCELKNLEWANQLGFKRDIDLDWVASLKDEELDYCALMVKNYLLTKKDIYLLNMIKSNLGISYLIFSDYKMNRFFKDYLTDCFIKLKTLCDKGAMKPTRNITYRFFKMNAKGWIKMYCKRQSPLTISADFVKERVSFNNSKNYELGDFENVSDEINDMFSQLCT